MLHLIGLQRKLLGGEEHTMELIVSTEKREGT